MRKRHQSLVIGFVCEVGVILSCVCNSLACVGYTEAELIEVEEPRAVTDGVHRKSSSSSRDIVACIEVSNNHIARHISKVR